MDSILKSRFQRATYFTGLIVCLVISILLKLYLVPQDYAIIQNLLDSVASTVVVSGIVTVLVMWLQSEQQAVGKVDVVDPWHSNDLHRAALTKTPFWYHMGHYGRWVRTEALRELRSRARTSVIDVCFVIIDPRDRKLCDEYVTYRKGERLGGAEEWDLEKLLFEIYSTIYAAYVDSKAAERLTVSVYLSNTFRVPRMDISSEWAISTHCDSRTGPILFPSNTVWYNLALADLHHAKRMSFRIDFDDIKAEPGLLGVTGEYLSSIIRELNIAPAYVPEAQFLAICHRVVAGYNRGSRKYD